MYKDEELELDYFRCWVDEKECWFSWLKKGVGVENNLAFKYFVAFCLGGMKLRVDTDRYKSLPEGKKLTASFSTILNFTYSRVQGFDELEEAEEKRIFMLTSTEEEWDIAMYMLREEAGEI